MAPLGSRSSGSTDGAEWEWSLLRQDGGQDAGKSRVEGGQAVLEGQQAAHEQHTHEAADEGVFDVCGCVLFIDQLMEDAREAFGSHGFLSSVGESQDVVQRYRRWDIGRSYCFDRVKLSLGVESTESHGSVWKPLMHDGMGRSADRGD